LRSCWFDSSPGHGKKAKLKNQFGFFAWGIEQGAGGRGQGASLRPDVSRLRLVKQGASLRPEDSGLRLTRQGAGSIDN
ncbi:MAG: hypothetical protein JW965_02975, partial [Bacteroidales bacterium]|nr:hypothetical protein [Bacteroidales bacterium]